MTELMLRDMAVAGLLLLGTALMAIAALGVIRMPDLYLRTSVSSKGVTLGVAALLLAAAVTFGDLAVSGRALAVIFFMLVTAPVAAHLLARAAYRNDVAFWSETRLDANVESAQLRRNLE